MTPGRSYLDGLSGLFVVRPATAGPSWPGRRAAGRAAGVLPHLVLCPPGGRGPGRAPGQLDARRPQPGVLHDRRREAVESAWKLAKQFFKVTGKPLKTKVVSRAIAYHGTPHGALSITGIPAAKAVFEPLVPGTMKVPTPTSTAPPSTATTLAFGRWAADQIEVAIEGRGADTVAAVFLEPVQNGGGCFRPAGLLRAGARICDRHDVLLVADETICAFGRIGEPFAIARFNTVPDIITCARA